MLDTFRILKTIETFQEGDITMHHCEVKVLEAGKRCGKIVEYMFTDEDYQSLPKKN